MASVRDRSQDFIDKARIVHDNKYQTRFGKRDFLDSVCDSVRFYGR
jgi:hypothetical protein